MDDISYPYSEARFVDFYDTVMETCYGGINCDDTQEVCALFRDRRGLMVHENSDFRTVDLGTGTGRCILALLSSLKEDAGIQQQKFEFIGVDISKAMIEKAREKLENVEGESKNVNVRLMVQSLEDWDVPEWYEGVDLITSVAGPFHHLLTEESLVKALRQIHLHLKRGGEGLAVIDFFDPKDRDSEEIRVPKEEWTHGVFKVGPYRVLQEHREMSLVDGARGLYEKFKLSRFSSDDKVEWEESEEWILREIDPERLVHLAGQVGLYEAQDICMPCKNCLYFCRK